MSAHAARIARGVLLLMAMVGCTRGGGASTQPAATAIAPTSASLAEEGERLLREPAPSHATLVDASERVGVAAVAEGSTSRGAALASMAARLRTRAFRVGGGVAEDARRAVDWWTVAAGRPEFAEACEAGKRRAILLGEIAHDPHVTYRELYVASRRLAASPCAATLEASLADVAPFRPSFDDLDALDRSLAGDGVIGAIDPSRRDHEDGGGARPHVTRVSRWSTGESARVVIELDRSASYRLEPATVGTVRVRLDGVDLGDAAAAKPIEASKGLLLGGSISPIARTADEPGGASVVLSLSRPAYRRVFFLPSPYRIVIDLSTTPPESTHLAGPRPLRRVVLDPGHGGADPGAVGPTGAREKDITLAIALDAAPLIARELGAEVRLTRATDTYVSLEDRAEAANAFGADVFVSIHCNADPSHMRRGVELYVLDTERDEIAQRVAARENGGNAAAPSELRAILDDLKLAELGARSQSLARLLQRSIMSSLHTGQGGDDDFGDVADGGVHGAGFFVLVGARMPAVLIETSFISNPIEEAYLSRNDYRARLVDAIVNGLRAYKGGS